MSLSDESSRVSPVSPDELERLLEQMIAQQRRRVAEYAARVRPNVTDDDLLQPMDVEELRTSPEWNYEDGVLNGYLAAQAAVRRVLRRSK